MPTASIVTIIVTVIHNDDDCYQNTYFNNESETVLYNSYSYYHYH